MRPLFELGKRKIMAQRHRPNLLLIGAGNMLVSMVVAGFLLGYLTDYWLGTLPLFLLVFGLLGLIGGIIKVHKLLTNPELNQLEQKKYRR